MTHLGWIAGYDLLMAYVAHIHKRELECGEYLEEQHLILSYECTSVQKSSLAYIWEIEDINCSSLFVLL